MQRSTGVLGAEIKGDHRNQIEVTGVEVDMICLTNTLRKKVAFAELVSVNKVEPPKKPEEKKPEPCYQPWHYVYGVPSSYPHPCDPYGYNGKGYTEEPVYNHEPNCRIMWKDLWKRLTQFFLYIKIRRMNKKSIELQNHAIAIYLYMLSQHEKLNLLYQWNCIT